MHFLNENNSSDAETDYSVVILNLLDPDAPGCRHLFHEEHWAEIKERTTYLMFFLYDLGGWVLMGKPSGPDVMQYTPSKLGQSPREKTANNHIWLLSARAFVLDTMLTWFHTSYTTWRQALGANLFKKQQVIFPWGPICGDIFIAESHFQSNIF